MWLYLVLDVATSVFSRTSPPRTGHFDTRRRSADARVRALRATNEWRPRNSCAGRGDTSLPGRTGRTRFAISARTDLCAVASSYGGRIRGITLAYVRLTQFLDEFPPPGGRATRRVRRGTAVVCDRHSTGYLYRRSINCCSTTRTRIKSQRSTHCCANVVYPWMPTLRRNDPAASDRYFDLLEAFASAAGDSDLSRGVEATSQRSGPARASRTGLLVLLTRCAACSERQ